MKQIKSIPEFDRPREKMEKKGATALSDLELLAVLLGSGIQGKDVFCSSKGYFSEICRQVAKQILRL